MGKVQGELPLGFAPTWGGKRERAGAKRTKMLVGERQGAAHVARPALAKKTVLHVTLRTVAVVHQLRYFEAYAALRRAALVVAVRDGFRILHVSLQNNHVHLVVEADSKAALANGMRAFQISMARTLNQRIFVAGAMRTRRGRVFADRYHARVLRSPTEMRNAIRYVLNNWLHHGVSRDSVGGAVVDPYSSASTFLGWLELEPGQHWRPAEGFDPLPTRAPQSWLASQGWLRAGGRISISSKPAT